MKKVQSPMEVSSGPFIICIMHYNMMPIIFDQRTSSISYNFSSNSNEPQRKPERVPETHAFYNKKAEKWWERRESIWE